MTCEDGRHKRPAKMGTDCGKHPGINIFVNRQRERKWFGKQYQFRKHRSLNWTQRLYHITSISSNMVREESLLHNNVRRGESRAFVISPYAVSFFCDSSLAWDEHTLTHSLASSFSFHCSLIINFESLSLFFLGWNALDESIVYMGERRFSTWTKRQTGCRQDSWDTTYTHFV